MCAQLMNSPAGAAACACDRGYELIAFQTKATVRSPDTSQISNTWAVINWEPLTTVSTRQGSSDMVAGFYIFYQVHACTYLLLNYINLHM